MAGAILSSIVTSVLKRLSNFTSTASSSSSTELPSSAEQELQKLERTMRRIHAVLEDAEEKDISDKSEQLRLRELKEVAFDAEDAVDEYEYEVLQAKVEARRRERDTHMGDKQVMFNLNSYHPKVPISDELASRVKDIRQRFEEITDDWNRISLKEKDDKRRCIRKWKTMETASWFDEAKTFGREDEKNEIIKWLLQKEDESSVHSLSILCIVGMGGLGKTTLAQMSYNDSRVCQHFNLRGWVYVSEDFDVVNLVKKICLSFGMKVNCSNDISLDQLHQELKAILDGKEFFVVLDDVWNQKLELWNSLKTLLVGVGMGKILVTTRDQRVSKIMQTTSTIILSHLSPYNSWLLFKKIANKSWDHNLLEIGKKIVDKCGGLPLAIKVLAGILSLEEEEEAWVDIMESELWELDKEKDDIFPILKLSYECLPVELKQCFMYLCLFPKGSFLDKSSIVQQWISHGFIQPKGKNMEDDVGSDYWNEFLHRSILQYNGIFFMHDLIHDLAQHVAKDEYLLMTSHKSPDMIPKKIRHISLHIEDDVDIVNLESLCQANHLRTLILSVPIKNLLPSLLRLRVLILDMWNYEDWLNVIGTMKHLRYLDISHAKSVPASVYNLHHLRTLRFFDALSKLPSDIGDLISLRHLNVNTSFYHLPHEVAGLTNLQTLPCIHLGVESESWKLRDLKGLPNLRGHVIVSQLEAVAWADVIPQEDYLKGKRGIKTLTLIWEEVENVDDRLAAQVLDSLQPHRHLRDLRIYNYSGVVLPMWLGHELPALKELNIDGARRVKSYVLSAGKKSEEFSSASTEEVESRRWFPSLENLSLFNMDELEEWQGAEDLRDLYISDCPKLRKLSTLPRLSTLHIMNCDELEWQGAEDCDLPCLHDLSISNCPNLRKLPSIPRLSSLSIGDCPELKSLSSLPLLNDLFLGRQVRFELLINLPMLRSLSIAWYSDETLIFPHDGSLNQLEELSIGHCQMLRSVEGFSRLASLHELVISSCPLLRFSPDERLPPNIRDVKIMESPGAEEWYQNQLLSISVCQETYTEQGPMTMKIN